jgi:hypothetical protein
LGLSFGTETTGAGAGTGFALILAFEFTLSVLVFSLGVAFGFGFESGVVAAVVEVGRGLLIERRVNIVCFSETVKLLARPATWNRPSSFSTGSDPGGGGGSGTLTLYSI